MNKNILGFQVNFSRISNIWCQHCKKIITNLNITLLLNIYALQLENNYDREKNMNNNNENIITNNKKKLCMIEKNTKMTIMKE